MSDLKIGDIVTHRAHRSLRAVYIAGSRNDFKTVRYIKAEYCDVGYIGSWYGPNVLKVAESPAQLLTIILDMVHPFTEEDTDA